MVMEKQSWVCTLLTQLSLCFGVYLALNMGQLQKPTYLNRRENKSIDMYFISVTGGFRPLKQQTHLLKQMEKVIKLYKARFVINLSDLGEDDPLMLNATWHFHSLRVPWYTTRALKGQEVDYYVKRIKIPCDKTLEVIALNTGSLQDSSSGDESDQLHWLTRTLEGSSSNWRIVVGFHPLVTCDENFQQKAKQTFEPLHHILVKHGADAYVSGLDCADFDSQGEMARIGSRDPMEKGPYFTNINKNSVIHKETVNGFLLHRVSSLEIVTYLVTLKGEVVHKISMQQRGREVM